MDYGAAASPATNLVGSWLYVAQRVRVFGWKQAPEGGYVVHWGSGGQGRLQPWCAESSEGVKGGAEEVEGRRGRLRGRGAHDGTPLCVRLRCLRSLVLVWYLWQAGVLGCVADGLTFLRMRWQQLGLWRWRWRWQGKGRVGEGALFPCWREAARWLCAVLQIRPCLFFPFFCIH